MIIDVQGCPTSPDTSAFYEKMHWELRELEAKAAKYDALVAALKRMMDEYIPLMVLAHGEYIAADDDVVIQADEALK